MMWIALFTFFLLGGYFIYGRKLEKNWEIDIYRDQSSWQEDESIISHFGLRYVQLAQFAVLLNFELLISVVFGYAYGLAYVFWLILGSILFGGALSYYGGMYSLRNRGYTLNYIIKQKFGTFSHICTTLLLLGLIALLLSDSYKSFGIVYEKIFDFPSYLLPIYCSVVALLFCFCTARQTAIIFSGIGIFTIITFGLLFYGSKLQINMIEYGAHNFVIDELKYAYPLAFFVITLGSINCLQGLQSSLLAPMIKNEKVGRRVFFGASVFQGFFLIIGNALVAAWNPDIQDFYASLFDAETPYTVLQNMAFGAGGKKATLLLFALASALFFGFVGVMARLARNLISETIAGSIKFLAGILAFLLVIVPVFWLKSFSIKFEYVLIFTQIVGLFSCLVLTKHLKDEQKKYYHLLWPAILVASALIAYILLVLLNCRLLTCYICGLAPLAASFVIHLLSVNKEKLRLMWQQHQEKCAELKRIKEEKAAQRKIQKEQEKIRQKEEAERKNREKEELKIQEAEKKKQKAEAKKQEVEKEKQETEEKKQASLSLLISQDETEGKKIREIELEKEIAQLQAERDKIDLRVKEIERELEKEQSKRLLLETSENVVEELEKTEDIAEELEKLDEVVSPDASDIEELIAEKEEPKPEEPQQNNLKFDFDDNLGFDFEFEERQEQTPLDTPPAEPDNKQKKKRKRNRQRKNKNPATNTSN